MSLYTTLFILMAAPSMTDYNVELNSARVKYYDHMEECEFHVDVINEQIASGKYEHLEQWHFYCIEEIKPGGVYLEGVKWDIY